MPFESRHTRFGIPTENWKPVPNGQNVAHPRSISKSRLRACIPGPFAVQIETDVTNDQSRLKVHEIIYSRTGASRYDTSLRTRVISETSPKAIVVKTGTLGRRIKFRPAK